LQGNAAIALHKKAHKENRSGATCQEDLKLVEARAELNVQRDRGQGNGQHNSRHNGRNT
jgi:hypothetical protein